MLCDRILLIHGGKLVEERLMAPLKDELRIYSVTFTGAASLIDLTQDLRAAEDGSHRARFSNKPELVEAIARITASGGKLLDVVSQEGSLEDYFIDTIERAA